MVKGKYLENISYRVEISWTLKYKIKIFNKNSKGGIFHNGEENPFIGCRRSFDFGINLVNFSSGGN